MTANFQPELSGGLVAACRAAMAELRLPAVWVHAGALAQHAVQVGLVLETANVRAVLDQLAALHPRLAGFAELPALTADQERVVTGLWKDQQLHTDEQTLWLSYPLGDLYQALSDQARKGRALCQTPWFIARLLLRVSYDRAQELWQYPRVVDPACGTGHLLVETLQRAGRSHSYYDGYSPVRPYLTHTPSLENALDRVHGVDLDPYAALVAAYRLVVAAWAQIRHRGAPADLAGLPVHVAAADALLATDEPLLQPGQYHVVVANPPYITVKDRATNAAIRARYPQVCHGTYSLALPFHALMMQLLVPGGWCGQLTANSFMKREFGKKYIEDWLPQYAMEWVIDTSGAYIPGHGTPTVILVHRNQPPTSDIVRAVQGVRGEPRRPEDPAKGLVWTAIANAVHQKEDLDHLARGYEAHARLLAAESGTP